MTKNGLSIRAMQSVERNVKALAWFRNRNHFSEEDFIDEYRWPGKTEPTPYDRSQVGKIKATIEDVKAVLPYAAWNRLETTKMVDAVYANDRIGLVEEMVRRAECTYMIAATHANVEKKSGKKDEAQQDAAKAQNAGIMDTYSAAAEEYKKYLTSVGEWEDPKYKKQDLKDVTPEETVAMLEKCILFQGDQQTAGQDDKMKYVFAVQLAAFVEGVYDAVRARGEAGTYCATPEAFEDKYGRKMKVEFVKDEKDDASKEGKAGASKK